MADNLKRSGAFIAGYTSRRQQTASVHRQRVLTRLTMFGSIVHGQGSCLLPQFLQVFCQRAVLSGRHLIVDCGSGGDGLYVPGPVALDVARNTTRS